MHSEFISLPQRRLFLIRSDASTTACQPIVTVLLGAFAEEMNKSRHLFSQCRQQLAATGGSYVQMDPYGTGDSDGDLDQTTVLEWRADLQALLALLQQRGYQAVNFIAMRFGALQLFDLLAQAEPLPLPLHKIVLWQPYLQSSQFLQQFFRLKVAEQMALGEKTSQQQLQQQLDNGEVLEIAGYPLTAAFVQSVKQLTDVSQWLVSQAQLATTAQQPATKTPLLWLETSTLPNLSPVVQKSVEQLSALFDTQVTLLAGAPYWTATELVACPELISATVDFLQEE